MSSLPERPASPDGGLSTPHLTGIDDLTDADLHYLLDLAQYYQTMARQCADIPQRLKGRTQVNLFLEDSTRTNMSFELAGKQLGANLLVVPVAASSVHKGEELRDTAQTLAAMGADAMIIRNKVHDTATFVADAFEESGIDCAVINAGEGTQSHPTQALLDAVTILDSLGRKVADGLDDISIAICGDIRHSRVAASNAELLPRLGAKLRFVGPEEFLPLPEKYPHIEHVHELRSGLAGCNFVMGLRVQRERLEPGMSDVKGMKFQDFMLTHETLKYAAPGAKVMHPGPMNRGVEIDGGLADDRSLSLILDQVGNGVSMRMAVLDALLTAEDGR